MNLLPGFIFLSGSARPTPSIVFRGLIEDTGYNDRVEVALGFFAHFSMMHESEKMESKIATWGVIWARRRDA